MFYDTDEGTKLYELQNDYKYFYSLCQIEPQLIAAGNANGSINIYSYDTKKRVHKIEEHCLPVRSMAYDKLNNKLISASDDLHINIMDSTTFKVIVPMVGHKDFISSFAISNDQGIYASASYDGAIKIWDIKQLKCVNTINLNSDMDRNILWDIDFTNSGKEIICGSNMGCHILSLV